MFGIEREIDRIGRMVIPMEFRKELGIEFDSKVLISLENGEIIIRPYRALCAICGERLQGYQKIRLCSSCITKVKNEF